MKYRRITTLLLTISLLCVLFTPCTQAAEGYVFSLKANGNNSATVSVGDTVTVTLDVSAASKHFNMYAVSATLRFYGEMFQISNNTPGAGIDCTAADSGDGWKDVTVNALSDSIEGDTWSSPATLITLKLTALKAGATKLMLKKAKVANETGTMQDYSSGTSDVSITIKNVERDDSGKNIGENTKDGTDNEPSSSGKDVSGSTETGSTDGGAVTEPEVTYNNPFVDVADDAWYSKAVQYVVESKLFTGTSASTFSPDSNMTRAMFVTVLHRYAGLPIAGSTAKFSDVSADSWYSAAVAWASENRIINGYGDGMFCPNKNITLEQMMTILYRYIGATGSGELPAEYGAVSNWAEDAMRWACHAKLFTGVEGTLRAKEAASRAQVAGFMSNFNLLPR